MGNVKYSVSSYDVSSLLTYIKQGEIAIPEIQRPFVWDGAKVRDLIDSLYNGYPTGYLIIWQNPTVKLKDGTSAVGKKILIDGQQRITALRTAITAIPILTEEYEEKVIKIAFNPMAQEGEDLFAVQTPVNAKAPYWIPDISVFFVDNFSTHQFLTQYYAKHNITDTNIQNNIEQKIEKLRAIYYCKLGTIELDSGLDINSVTEIFVRINSKGVRLNEADFAMSKMAADEKYGGNALRKAIDYFCHLYADPSFYKKLSQYDPEFIQSDYGKQMNWLATPSNTDDIYMPDYSDMLRVSFMHQFKERGKLADLVNLLSGRDFLSRTYKETIAEDSFKSLSEGVMHFTNSYNFSQFILAIKSIGFISPKLLSSKMALDFAYTVMLLLMKDKNVPSVSVKTYMQKWFVLSVLTGRYTSSPESQFDKDLKEIKDKGFITFLQENEKTQLSEDFWNAMLVDKLETSSIKSPCFSVYLAAQKNDISLLSKDCKIHDLIATVGDIHHIFPAAYLKANKIDKVAEYNQVANFVYLDKPVNIFVGKQAPKDYFMKALNDCRENSAIVGLVDSEQRFWESLDVNCVPYEVCDMDYSGYQDFLKKRRVLMAKKIRKYYESL